LLLMKDDFEVGGWETRSAKPFSGDMRL